MFKDKKTIYIIIFVLVLLGGIILLASKKDNNTKVEKNNLNLLLPTKKVFSFNKAVGKEAPDFSLESIDNSVIKLSDYRGKKDVILFFSGGSMCYPACWDQIQEFGQDKRFNTNNVIAFSVVVNPKSTWEKIVKETPEFSKAKILFDTTKAVSSAYDVMALNSSMHPNRYPGHTYFIIDKKGIIRYIFDDPNMAIRNNMIFSALSKIGEE